MRLAHTFAIVLRHGCTKARGLFFLAFVISSTLSAQSGLEPVATYERLLDRVLAVETPTLPPRFEIRIRFRPSFHPECQVVIRQSVDGKGSLSYVEADTQVWKLVETITSDTSIEIAAKQVKRTALTVSVDATTTREFLRGLFRSLNASTGQLVADTLSGEETGAVTIQLDGTNYSLEYEGSQQRLSLTVPGSEIGTASTSDDIAVVQWMNVVLGKARELARTAKGDR
jgi:hypothetical protein